MSTRKRLLLVGAGSLARELRSWLAGALPPGHEIGGFLSDNPADLDRYPHYQPGIVGPVAGFVPGPDDVLVMAINRPRDKLRVAAELEARGGSFLTFVHPTATLADHVAIGRGVVICPHAVVSCDARLGDFVTINLGSTVGHDVNLGRGSTLSAHVDLTGFVQVGEGAFFGSHATALPRATIGEHSVVGAGSVVLRSVKPGVTVMGVPAKQISP